MKNENVEERRALLRGGRRYVMAYGCARAWATLTSSGEVARQEDGSLVQSGSLAAQNGLPESVTLRAYNCWTKERYETNELTLNP